MDLTPFLGFAAVSLTLVLTPGADWAYTIAAGIRGGSAAPSVAGLCAGYLGHTALVATGLGVLLAARPELVAWLAVAGAVYLLWLGTTTARGWRAAGYRTDCGTAGMRSTNPLRDFLRGAGTSGINPKGFLLFLAVMPQFVRAGSAVPVPLQTAAMGLTHVAISVVVYGLVAVAARRLLSATPRRAQFVTLASGIIMLGFGGVLLAEQAAALMGHA
ncbi:LysE family translocator [Sinomonas sp. ASV322]|uniref:LysE family translocator n=1 Tax=Sinomonas sp. ASV322 TaxID=3041920 RepID=UPI0027DE2F10|nr:LysE family translocator [Sinomonas sp. ASV322]MDQ4503315.1 LysE family translocator [Sinomonas sp. ASV322]